MTKDRNAPPPASHGPGNSPSPGEQQIASVSARTKTALGAYLCGLLAMTVVTMLWVWSSIPLTAKEKQAVASQPALQSATTPQVGDAKTPNPSEPSHYCRVLANVFHEDVLYLLLVLIMGTMGGTLYGMLGFCLHLAMGDFKAQWNSWYVFRPFLGAGLALLVYLAIRGGFLTLSNQETTLSLYSTAALAGLCGMFSEQASKKLAEIFKTLFRTEDDVVRSQEEEKERKAREAAQKAGRSSAPGAAPAESTQQPKSNPAGDA